MNKKNREIKPIAIDLFAGAGGFSLAAVQAGCTIAVAIENDAYAVKTYKENILKYDAAKNAKVLDKSILEYVPESVRDEILGNVQCDLLLGGPPCQGFSTHRILDAGVNDPRNQLVLSYFSFVKAFRPRVFLMENVPGILWERHKEFLEKFYEEGSKAGYHVFRPVVLDARDFGVPQRRKRVFILGVRDAADVQNFIWPPQATHSAPGKVKSGQKLWVPCANVFKPAPANDENDIHMNHGPDLIEAFSNTPPNGGSRKDSGRILPCHEQHDGHKDVYGRIDPAEPAPTMTTACINPSKGRFVHPTEHHGITLRQAARIQTFPDNFTFTGGLTAAGRQIGNAVPVELGKYLIKHIKSYLIDKTLDQTHANVLSCVQEYQIEKV
ncbi:DNA cytosine methyltransferase [Pantoea phytobeneficialis]|uniref:Cytosine-specific methyltransferase n=1 Tax=Pantoea phytobeneficialis TaxID=2052056 RepID=A0AAP9KNH2_9GAMM|nr:DNA cytosine methyltransferase [Pantoea phytobeneficialis]MDO6407226.1 DNA cytosine methyltransferase [Pantoea phytobeneficialis]QGR05848.1 DNA (cytosine-5-)-methyltransferase [Pantoea phytobeneficialis]